MNNRRKHILLTLVLVMAVVLSACSSSTASDSTTTSAEEAVVEETATETEEEATTEVAEEADADADSVAEASTTLTYPIVDTNQGLCFSNSEIIDCPSEGEAFYGQDAQFTSNVPSYTDNGDGTINDNVTGLVWTQEISSYTMPWSDACGLL